MKEERDCLFESEYREDCYIITIILYGKNFLRF